jgi:putative transposase
MHGLRPTISMHMLTGMARLPRIDLPGIPQHVVQRGNNRLPCFLDDGDRLRYLQLLRESLATTYCGLHAYHASNPTASGRGP